MAAVVEDFVIGSGAGGNTTLTLPSGAPSVGDVLILECGSSSGSDASSPASGQGGVTTWTQLISTVRRSSQIWYGVVDGTPSASVQFNNQFRVSAYSLLRVSGLDTASLVHGTPLAANNQNSNPTAGAFTPTAGADVFLFSGIASQVATVVDPSSPWVNIITGSIGACAYRIVTGATGSYQATWDTTNGFATWDAQLVAFNVAASGVDGTGAATLTIGVSGTAVVEVVATGAATISIGASGTATIAAAEATGAATIAIGAAGTAEVAVDASGAVTIAIGASGTGTISVAVAGAATFTIGAAGTATVATVATGSATLTIGASGQVALAVTASGAAAIAIDAAGSASIPVTATGGATLAIAASGTGIVGNPPVEVDGAASIVLGASGTAVVDVTGSGATQVSLGAAGTASVAVLASGAVAVSVAVGGQAQVAIAGTAAASLSIGASGSATVPVQASGSATLSVSATGQAGISVVAAGAAALFLDAVGSATIADAPTSFLRPLSIELLEAMGLTVTLTAAPHYSVTLET